MNKLKLVENVISHSKAVMMQKKSDYLNDDFGDSGSDWTDYYIFAEDTSTNKKFFIHWHIHSYHYQDIGRYIGSYIPRRKTTERIEIYEHTWNSPKEMDGIFDSEEIESLMEKNRKSDPPTIDYFAECKDLSTTMWEFIKDCPKIIWNRDKRIYELCN